VHDVAPRKLRGWGAGIVLLDDRNDLASGKAGFPHDVGSFGVEHRNSTFIPGSIIGAKD
jgi:hypothetical protein